MLNFEKFTYRLDELIYDTQLQQNKFARDVGIAPSKISEYLKGKRLPSIKTLVKLADYFECSTDYILGLEQEKYKCTPKPLPPFKERIKYLLKHFGYTNHEFCKKATDINEPRYYD